MSVTMSTYGSGLALRPGTDEAALTMFARELLEQDLTGFDLDEKYGADLDRIRTATTLEDLFAAFAVASIRDTDGNLIGCFGVDGVHKDTTLKLFAALAPALVDGSFFAYHLDYGADRIIYVEHGTAHELMLDEGTLGPTHWREREQMTAGELTDRLWALDGAPRPVRVLPRPHLGAAATRQLCEDGTAYVPD